MSLLASSSRTTARTSLPSLVRGAKTQSSGSKKVEKEHKSGQNGPPPDMPGDSATDTLKKELYPTIRPSLRSSSPYSSPRPDRLSKLPLVLPSLSAHDTIERAQLVLHLDLLRSRKAVLRRKNQLIFEAVEELRLTDKRFYDLATEEKSLRTDATMAPVRQGRGKVERLFPLEMRLPTDTPGTKGWDYTWRYVPEEKALERISFRVVQEDVAAGGGEAAKV